eukprot:gene21132-25376_t
MRSQKKLPVAQKKLPVAQKNLPVAQKKLPVAQKKLPVAQKKLPVAQKKLPVAQKGAPKETALAPLGHTLYAPPSSIEMIVREDYQQMLEVPLVKEILKLKWKSYAQFMFRVCCLLYASHMVLFVSSILDTFNERQQRIAENVIVAITCLFFAMEICIWVQLLRVAVASVSGGRARRKRPINLLWVHGGMKHKGIFPLAARKRSGTTELRPEEPNITTKTYFESTIDRQLGVMRTPSCEVKGQDDVNDDSEADAMEGVQGERPMETLSIIPRERQLCTDNRNNWVLVKDWGGWAAMSEKLMDVTDAAKTTAHRRISQLGASFSKEMDRERDKQSSHADLEHLNTEKRKQQKQRFQRALKIAEVFLRSCVQDMKHHHSYFLWVYCYIALTQVYVKSFYSGETEDARNMQLVIGLLCGSFYLLLYFCRGFVSLGIYGVMIWTCMIDIVLPFLIICTVFLLSFGAVFTVLF